jgi:hypothetical protein
MKQISSIRIIYIPEEIGVESLRSFRRLYRLSISSGDSKSISFDDFFRTRPDRDTPVTSKSENYYNNDDNDMTSHTSKCQKSIITKI